MAEKKEVVDLTPKDVKGLSVDEFVNIIAQSKLVVYESKEQFESALKKYNDYIAVLIQVTKKGEEEIGKLFKEVEGLKAKKV